MNIRFYQGGEFDFLVRVDSSSLTMLLAQIAASLLTSLTNLNGLDPTSYPLGRFLYSRMDWKPHVSSALRSQAELLYAAVEASVERGTPVPPHMEKNLAKLISQALAEFQSWKTEAGFWQGADYWASKNREFLRLWED